mgnify:CR=1 FL=1
MSFRRKTGPERSVDTIRKGSLPKLREKLLEALQAVLPITAIVLGAMAVFLQTYQRSLIRSVQTSARQSVAQVGKTVEDYLDDAAKPAEE